MGNPQKHFPWFFDNLWLKHIKKALICSFKYFSLKKKILVKVGKNCHLVTKSISHLNSSFSRENVWGGFFLTSLFLSRCHIFCRDWKCQESEKKRERVLANVCVCICMCVYVCVCVHEKEIVGLSKRERDWEMSVENAKNPWGSN